MSVLYTLLFLVISIGISILAAIISLRLIGQSLNRQYIYFGMGIFFVGIAFHSLLALPIVVSVQGFKIFFGIPNGSEINFKLWELFYFAAAAGVGQEIAKALPIWFELKRTGNKNPTPPFYWLGLNIGLGFSLSEILIIGITSWQPHMAELSLFNVFMGSFERLSATLFHVATAGLIAFGLEKRNVKYFLAVSIILHTFLDAFAGYFEKFPILSLRSEEVLLFLFSLILLLFSMSFVKRYQFTT